MCELKYKLYLWEDIPHLRLNKPQKTAMKTEQINATGIVIESLEHFFQDCCKKSLAEAVQERNVYNTMAEMIDVYSQIDTEKENIIALPAKFESDALAAAPQDFVRVLEAPGAVHVERRVGQELIVGMFNAIWPMIITVLLSSGFAAVIIWLLEFRVKDNRMFKRGFATGVFNGYWFSFITMLTVGYGDKIPRSILGKIFGMIWALVGVTIMCVFTASVTNYMSAASLRPEGLSGLDVMVENGSIERHLVLQQGGNPIEVSNFTELYNFLDNCIDGNPNTTKKWENTRRYLFGNKQSIPCGGVIDHYRVLSQSEKFNNDRLHVRTKATEPVTIGFLLAGSERKMNRNILFNETNSFGHEQRLHPTTTTSLLKCLKRNAFMGRMHLDKVIRNQMQHAQREENKSSNYLQMEVEFHDVLLLKPEKLKATLITATVLLFAFVLIVGTFDW